MSRTDFTVTRDDIVRTALKRIGVSRPSTSEVSQAASDFNKIVRRLDQQGRWLHAISATESTITTIAGTSSYNVATNSLQPNIIRLEKVSIRRGSAPAYSRTDLAIVDKTTLLDSYHRDSSSGDPAIAHLQTEPELANQTLILYPVPSSALTVAYNYQRAIYEFDAASENPDVPIGWVICLEDQLTERLSAQYGIPGDMQLKFKADAKESLDEVRAANSEGTTLPVMRTQFF